jgi:hypothetical protein
MGWDNLGNWAPFDTQEPVNQDLLDDGYREPPQGPPSYDFNGHNAPSSVFTTETDTRIESSASWIPARKELRLYIVAGVVGQLVSAMDLKTELGKARSEHGRVDFISLVFRDGDYKARSTESANLRGWLSRNGFRKIDSYNGHGVLVEKDLTRKAEPRPEPTPKPELKPLTPTEQARRYREAGLNIPPYLQRDLEHERRLREDAENDPARRLAEVKARIELLEKLKAESGKKTGCGIAVQAI